MEIDIDEWKLRNWERVDLEISIPCIASLGKVAGHSFCRDKHEPLRQCQVAGKGGQVNPHMGLLFPIGSRQGASSVCNEPPKS